MRSTNSKPQPTITNGQNQARPIFLSHLKAVSLKYIGMKTLLQLLFHADFNLIFFF